MNALAQFLNENGIVTPNTVKELRRENADMATQMANLDNDLQAAMVLLSPTVGEQAEAMRQRHEMVVDSIETAELLMAQIQRYLAQARPHAKKLATVVDFADRAKNAQAEIVTLDVPEFILANSNHA